MQSALDLNPIFLGFTKDEIIKFNGTLDSWITYQQMHRDIIQRELDKFNAELANHNMNREIFGQMVCSASINNTLISDLMKQFQLDFVTALQYQIDRCNFYIKQAESYK